MRSFQYKGFDRAGRAVKGMMEAPDIKSVREKLSKSGVLANSIVPAGEEHGLMSSQSAMDTATRSLIYRELGALLKAGLPVSKALDILVGSPEMARHQSSLGMLRDRLREGAGIAGAFQGAIPTVTPFETALLEVGERAGTMPETMFQLSSVMDEQEELREKVVTALIYPAIVVAVALLVAVGVFGFALPKMNALLTEMRIPQPALTRFMLSLGHIFRVWSIPVLAAAVGAGYWLKWRLRSSPERRMAFSRMMFSIPVLGSGQAILANLRFAHTLSVLLKGGVPAVDGIVLAGRATGSAWVDHLVTEAADRVRHGETIAAAIRQVPPLAGGLPGWIEAGEASGDMDNLLAGASERYQRAWENFVQRTLKLVEPVLILALGLFVLLVALSILMPIVSASQILK